MKYMMLIYETPPNIESRKDPGHDPYVAAWKAYHKALVAAGAYVSGAPLKDMTTATTVRLRDGKRRVQDGPFAEAKEQLGGVPLFHRPFLHPAPRLAPRFPPTPAR